MMVPINTGKFIIEPATIEVDGKSYTSNAVEIEVVQTKSQPKATNPNPSRGNGNTSNQRQAPPSQDIKNNLFLKLDVSKKRAFRGEAIVATYKLYNRLDLTNIEGQKLPDFVGFYTNDVPIDQNNNASREVVDNVIYQVYTLKKTTLFPQRTGELEIRPLELFATIREREPTPINTFFGPRYRYKNKRVELKSNAVTITVNQLPSAPSSFTGSVGAFNLQSSLDNKSVNVNNAINLKYVVTGSGNIDLVELPEIDFPVDFEVYDPKVNVSSQNVKGSVSGKKTIEYLIIPRVVGDFTIPATQLTYFNPATNQYETASAPEYTVQVMDDGSGAPTKATVQSKRDIQQIGTDIRFIKTSESDFLEGCAAFFGSVWFFLWLILPILLGVGLWIAFRRYEDMQSDKVGMKKRRAGKVASKQLKAASQALANNDTAAFYQELSKGLNTYLSFKLALGTADLAKDQIVSKLAEANVNEELIQQVLHILEQCEMARYAPSAVSDEQSLYASAEKLIENLEKELK
jgi:hypothetical protein